MCQLTGVPRLCTRTPSGVAASTLACGLCCPYDHISTHKTLFLLEQRLRCSGPHHHNPATFRILNVSSAVFPIPAGAFGDSMERSSTRSLGWKPRKDQHSQIPPWGGVGGGRMGQAVTEYIYMVSRVHTETPFRGKSPVPGDGDVPSLGSGHPEKNGVCWSHIGGSYLLRESLPCDSSVYWDCEGDHE